MKKFLIVFGIISGLVVSSQTLIIPTGETYGDLGDSIQQWQKRSWISPLSSDGTNSVYQIYNGWNPAYANIVSIIQAGGNTSNYPLYFRISDSLFFDSQIPDDIGTDLYDIQGRYTTELLTWGNYLEVSHEVYWQSNNSYYYVLALKDDGTRMTLNEANQIRINNAYVVSVQTITFLKGLPQSILYKRTAYNVWENNQF